VALFVALSMGLTAGIVSAVQRQTVLDIGLNARSAPSPASTDCAMPFFYSRAVMRLMLVRFITM